MSGHTTNRLVELPIKGLHCADCANHLEKAITQIRGVRCARVSLASSKLMLEVCQADLDMVRVEREVKKLGLNLGQASGLATVSFRVKGMDCSEEVRAIEDKFAGLAGVENFDVNLALGRLQVTFDAAALSPVDLVGALKELGLEATPEHQERSGDISSLRRRKLILTVLSGALLALGFAFSLTGLSQPVLIAAYSAAIVSGGFYVVRSGFRGLVGLRLDMNSLMTIAIVGAAVIGEWAEGATVAFLFSLAQLLESHTMERARRAISRLIGFTPKLALVQKDGEELSLPVEDVQVSDIIVVKPGERIPLDGRVIRGYSEVNQAPITGESMPVDRTVGDQVYAGSINGSGSLEVEVSHLSKDSTMARIIHMVEEAQSRRAPVQRFVDRFARYYTPAVIGASVLVVAVPTVLLGAPFSIWFYRALVLLVIACPCALVISTPVSILAALSAAARVGVLIKGGAHLELAGKINVVALDKTGTLTKGMAHVVDLLPLNGHQPQEVLSLAAAIETRSEHHLAKAILRKAAQDGIVSDQVSNFQALPGEGARADIGQQTFYLGSGRLFRRLGLDFQEAEGLLADVEKTGKTVVFVGTANELWGGIALADTLRENAADAIKELHALGIGKVVMLTGDNPHTARYIADKLGIDDYRAGLLPEDKVRVVENLVAAQGKVAMVGDGINDAPALAAAHLGIAMGIAGTDTALETADIALMGDDLSKLPLTIRLSRRGLRIIKANVALALSTKALFFALALSGLTSLWMAVAADMGASLLVIGNAMRLIKPPK
ncbi:MAG: heavy metal translocating P-type ATPase [Dehalococcoidales bacterium]